MHYEEWFTQFFCRPESLLLFCTWLGGLALCILFFFKRFVRVYFTQWYDFSKKGPNEEMDWCQIRFILNNDALQAMSLAKRFRLPLKYVVVDILGLSILGLVFYSILVLLLNREGIDIEYGIAIGVVTILVSIATIFYNVRIRSRSQNRQEWINAIRTEIAALISALPAPDTTEHETDEVSHKIQNHFAMLELYLNPSEPVHRAFLAVLRLMYRRMYREIDAEVCKKLCIDASQCPWQVENDDNERHWMKWRTKTVRLANVLLKREWEQVKHVK